MQRGDRRHHRRHGPRPGLDVAPTREVAGAGLAARSGPPARAARAACARRPWSPGAGPRDRGARRRAWRSTRAPCAARRRRSPLGRRPRRRDARRCRAACPRPGSARRTPPRRAVAAPRRAAALPGQRLQRAGQQQAADVDRDAGAPRRRIGDDLAQRRLRPRPDPPRGSCGGRAGSTTLPGHDVGVRAAGDRADVEVRMADAGHASR